MAEGRNVDHIKQFYKCLVFLSRQCLCESICWHVCRWDPSSGDPICLDLLSQPAVDIDMSKTGCEPWGLALDHAKRLLIVAVNNHSLFSIKYRLSISHENAIRAPHARTSHWPRNFSVRDVSIRYCDGLYAIHGVPARF